MAGIKFYQGDGVTERSRPIKIDFNRIIGLDTLISNPPPTVASVVDRISWIDGNFNIFNSLLKSNY